MTSHVTVEAIRGSAWSSYFNAPENTFFWGYSGVSAFFALFFTRTKHACICHGHLFLVWCV